MVQRATAADHQVAHVKELMGMDSARMTNTPSKDDSDRASDSSTYCSSRRGSDASTYCSSSSNQCSMVDSHEMLPETTEAWEVFSFQGDATSGAISGEDFSHIKDLAQELDDFDESSPQNTGGSVGIGAEVFAIHSRQVTASNDQHAENTLEGIHSEASRLQRELDASQAELIELRAQFAGNNVVGTLWKQLMQTKKENEALRQEKQSVRQNEVSGEQELPTKKAQSSSPALQDVLTRCRTMEEQNDALKSEMEKLDQQHKALASDHEVLACDYRLLDKQSMALASNHELLADDYRLLNKQCIQQRDTLKMLEDEKAALRHESDMTKHSHDCLSKLYGRVLDLQEELQSEQERLLHANEILRSRAASFETMHLKGFGKTEVQASFEKQEKPAHWHIDLVHGRFRRIF